MRGRFLPVARTFVVELTRSCLIVYPLLLLAMGLFYVGVVAVHAHHEWAWLGRSAALQLGLLSFPALLAFGGRVQVRVRDARYDLSGLPFALAWVSSVIAAQSFFGSTAHDLDLYLDGSHGRFCADERLYLLDRRTLVAILFGLVPGVFAWLHRRQLRPRRLELAGDARYAVDRSFGM